MENKQRQTYKVIIVGDARVGKTTFINRHLTGEFRKHYTPTMGVAVMPLIFRTNRGNRTLNIWDCAGQEKFSGLKTGYYENADAAVIMFDVTSRTSYRNVTKWRSIIPPHIPIVLCGNKVDSKNRNIKSVENSNLTYYDVSAKSNFNFEKPFLTILRQLENDEDLELI